MAHGAQTDRLYEADPREFVAARDRLAKELRAEGKRDEASALKARRRPSVAAWALNQVARQQPEAIADLLDALERAQSAQDDVLAGGDRDRLRTALADRRDALRTVTRHAAAVVEGSGRSPDATVREIETALQRTLSDEFVDALRAGELSDLDAFSHEGGEGDEGMGADLADLLSASVGLKERVDEPEPEPPKPSKRELERRRRLEARVTEREAELRDAEADLRAAQAAVERAERALEKARAELED